MDPREGRSRTFTEETKKKMKMKYHFFIDV